MHGPSDATPAVALDSAPSTTAVFPLDAARAHRVYGLRCRGRAFRYARLLVRATLDMHALHRAVRPSRPVSRTAKTSIGLVSCASPIPSVKPNILSTMLQCTRNGHARLLSLHKLRSRRAPGRACGEVCLHAAGAGVAFTPSPAATWLPNGKLQKGGDHTWQVLQVRWVTEATGRKTRPPW